MMQNGSYDSGPYNMQTFSQPLFIIYDLPFEEKSLEEYKYGKVIKFAGLWKHNAE